jgi:sec-independent protein translocase protein TatB
VLGLSPVRLLIIAVVALILLGPDKLPQLAKQAGAAWKTIRNLSDRIETELREAVPDLPRTADIARYARSPVSLLNQLADKAATDEEGGGREGTDSKPAPAGPAFSASDEPPADRAERPPVSWGDPSLN